MKHKQRKRLTIEDRMIIQACIHDHRNITQIASRLGVNKSTITRELKINSYVKSGNKIPCKRKRAGMCNGCPSVAYCGKEKRFYNFKLAEEKSSNRRSTSRSHSKLSQSSIKEIDEAVRDGVSLGQSLHHIFVSYNLANHCSERTVRRLCYRGILSSKPHELRRYVTYRHAYKKEIKDIQLRDIRVLIGRTYKDYKKVTSTHKKYNIVQYDSIVGKREDKKAILTITFPKYSFQFGLLINKGSPSNVITKIKGIFAKLESEMIKDIFPINLADNGVEFSYFNQIEINEDGEKICSTFFTNPYKATDKAECERLHELVRYFLPKGKSLDLLTQDKIDEMFSNINSYVRKSQGDKTPYDLVKKKFGKEFLDKIGIKRIANKKVRLRPII